MSQYDDTVAPRAGWGQLLHEFLPPYVHICNDASSGRSSKSFIMEGRLQRINENIEAGDYLFVQFGHNDQKEDSERHTSPFTTFKTYLQEYIDVARNNNATPILITPVQRRSFDDKGNFNDTHGDYPLAMEELAEESKIQLLDLASISTNLFIKMGPEQTKKIFLWLNPGEHPNYPDGVQDNTHFSYYGAKKVAGIVVQELGFQKKK